MRMLLRVPQGEVGDVLLEFGKRRIGKIEEVVGEPYGGFMRAEVLFDREEDFVRYQMLARRRWKMILYTEKEGASEPKVVEKAPEPSKEGLPQGTVIFACKR